MVGHRKILCNTPKPFARKIANGTPEIGTQKIIFHQDNAAAHTCTVSMAKVHELGFKFLPHPPYSPDLVPSDLFLFPILKVWLGGKRFSPDEEVVAIVDEYLKGFGTFYLSEGIKKLGRVLDEVCRSRKRLC